MRVIYKTLFLVIFLFINSLYALSPELVQLYRTKGIDAVEQRIQEQLKTREYWEDVLEKKDVSNGYYESIQYLVICQKDMKDMILYDTKKSKKLFSTPVYVGQKEGDKQKEGDLKTPVGAYSLTKRRTDVDPFYGPLALTTNYPNIYDKAQGKTGHGIWIHGVPEDEKRDDFTKGCIALENNNIEKLDKTIKIDESILLISQTKFQEVSKSDISIMMSSLFKWRDAWKKSDITTYLSFYDDNFVKGNGQNLHKFKQYKKRVFSKKEKKIIKLSNINIIPYPNTKNKKMFKIVMDELYKTNSHKFNGKKALYVELLNDRFSILTES
jgi:murein L,D-transpeptidase YafK